MAFTRRRRAVLGALALALVLPACKISGFYDPAAKSTAADAAAWLATQQQADGGFEVAQFPGFETSDAILAIAENAQEQVPWDTGQARRAVQALSTNGRTPLDAIDDFAEGPISAAQAAKVIVLVAKPLGYSPAAFDPQGDGATNLLALVNAGLQPDGSYGAFNGTLYAALARKLTDSVIHDTTLSLIRNGQHADGGWNFAGDQSAIETDIDTTALALQVLIAAGAEPSDPAVQGALRFLAERVGTNGAWQAFGADDPNSTSTALLAVTAAGYDANRSCWRDTFAPARAGQPYASPVTWLESQQQPDGRIASPNDAFPPINTFATSQSIQALRRGWLPITFHHVQPC